METPICGQDYLEITRYQTWRVYTIMLLKQYQAVVVKSEAGEGQKYVIIFFGRKDLCFAGFHASLSAVGYRLGREG